VYGYCDDADDGKRVGDPAGGFQPADTRHADIHEDDIGSLAAGNLDSLFSVTRLGDDIYAVHIIEYPFETGTNQVMVIHYHHIDHLLFPLGEVYSIESLIFVSRETITGRDREQ
jgi:hypothetical protein